MCVVRSVARVFVGVVRREVRVCAGAVRGVPESVGAVRSAAQVCVGAVCVVCVGRRLAFVAQQITCRKGVRVGERSCERQLYILGWLLHKSNWLVFYGACRFVTQRTHTSVPGHGRCSLSKWCSSAYVSLPARVPWR
jgi:hypothetical protein